MVEAIGFLKPLPKSVLLDILDHKTDIFVQFSDHHSKTRPFYNHLNTRLVQYSDSYCTWALSCISNKYLDEIQNWTSIQMLIE